MKDRIKVIIKNPDEPVGHIAEIDNTLEALQQAVQGYIEVFRRDIAGPVIICNEEGWLNDMDINCWVYGIAFFGPIVVVGVEGEDFSDCPISMEEWRRLLDMEEWKSYQANE